MNSRAVYQKEFEKFGLNSKIVQCSVSFNKLKGTIRGMHYQENPFNEIKLVRCTKGKIYDVIIDLRSSSKTFMKWFGIELSSENYKMIYIPEGFAHGFQTLQDETEIFYQMSEFYMPKHSKGLRWNDPSFGINWPLKPTIISKKDSSYPNFQNF